MDNSEMLQAMRQIVKEEMSNNNMQIATMIEESEMRTHLIIGQLIR